MSDDYHRPSVDDVYAASGYTPNGVFGSIVAASGIGESWRPVDLTAIVTGGQVDPPPNLLTREDGNCLLYAGKIHTLSGESESLKTWLALLAVAEVITAAGHALFIDYEDSATGIVNRLLALGCAPAAVLDHFSYVRPCEPYGPVGREILATALRCAPLVVVIDGVTEAMASHGLDPLSNADVAKFDAWIPKPMAEAGAAVAMIDHVTKSRETRGRYAIGAQHKLAAITGAAYTVELIKPFGHGLHGMAKILVAKDRLGRVREHSPGSVAGVLHLESQLDGSALARIEAPRQPRAEEPGGGFRPTVLMERVSQTIEGQPGLSGRTVVDLTKGKATGKRTALELLVAEGFVMVKREGSTHRHYSARPYRNEEEE